MKRTNQDRPTGAVIVGTEFESGVAVAFVRAEVVDAGAVVADVGVALAFVDIDAGIASRSQSVAAATHALERSLEVVAFAVAADSGPLATLVDICGNCQQSSTLQLFIQLVSFIPTQSLPVLVNL